MSQRIPAKLKAELGEYLAQWYRQYGKVAPRRPYHEDDDRGSSGAATNAPPLFEGHPLFNEMPLGASSDLATILVDDKRTLEEADKRTDELTEELQNKLALALSQKKQKNFLYQQYMKPTL
jgi:hypothetical protein